MNDDAQAKKRTVHPSFQHFISAMKINEHLAMARFSFLHISTLKNEAIFTKKKKIVPATRRAH